LGTDERLFELQSQICRTLAHPKRLQIIELLKTGERTVSDLAEALGVPIPNVSQHLQMLRQTRLVTTRRDGVNVYYSLSNPKIVLACNTLREVLAEQLEIDRAAATRGVEAASRKVEAATL